MPQPEQSNTLFVSALKEAVRQYPNYFFVTGEFEQIDSMWDMQPQYSMLESLLLEDESTQQFIIAVWSFFRPISLEQSSFADATRKLHHWQKGILTQLILNDPLSEDPHNEPLNSQASTSTTS